MTFTPMTWVFLGVSLFVLVIIMRLTLRVSAQWQMLKKDWTWKDEFMDTLFYFGILAVAVFGLFKLVEILPS